MTPLITFGLLVLVLVSPNHAIPEPAVKIGTFLFTVSIVTAMAWDIAFLSTRISVNTTYNVDKSHEAVESQVQP